MESYPALVNILHYINTFEWVPGTTALSSPQTPLIATCVYLIGLLVIPRLMKDREPYKLTAVVAAHNLLLCLWSLVMFLAIAYYIAGWAWSGGLYRIVCDPGNLLGKGPHMFWYYIFYLSKFYEFLDTLSLLLRKKKPIFLHTYHHVITLWLVWTTLTYSFSVQWSDITANAFVHIIMYYYYYLMEKGVQVWWKKYITKIQIIQFVVDMSLHFMWYYYSQIEGHTCAGDLYIYHFGNFVIMSFLLLFIKFYYDSYKRRGTLQHAKKAA